MLQNIVELIDIILIEGIQCSGDCGLGGERLLVQHSCKYRIVPQMICCTISVITSDILVNQLFNDRRDGVSLSLISLEVLVKKVVKTYFMDEFFYEEQSGIRRQIPAAKIKR